MIPVQVELQRDGQSLGSLPAGELQALLEASFVTEQQFIDFRLRHRQRLPGAGGSQPD